MNRTLLSTLCALAMLGSCGPSAFAGITIQPSLTAQERAARQAQLGQIAILVDALSQGKSRLLIGSAVSANPGSRALPPGEDAYVTVYPLSSPLATCLTIENELPVPALLHGKILGAIHVFSPISGPSDKPKAQPGTYMMFVPMGGIVSSERCLVSLAVNDEGKIIYKIVARTTENVDVEKMAAVLKASTGAAQEPKVSVSIQTTALAISMAWGAETYKLSFDMDIIYR